MGFIRGLFGGNSNQSSQPRDEDGFQYPTEEERESFMRGYRTGCPLEGEPAIEEENPDDPQYQRGLAAGQRDYYQNGWANEDGSPKYRYDE